jgi:UDP-N-acetyl-L-fucosamine synthase
VPEELNRRVVDHVSDFNLVYTEHARRNLLSEGIHPRRIYLTGSPMREVLEYARPSIDQSQILKTLNLTKNNYFLVSLHRAENVDIPRHLKLLVDTLNHLAADYKLPVIVSTHPRTRDKLDKLGQIELNPQIHFLKPFGYHDYVHLQMHARCTLSDSGTISEESSILGFPAVTIRNSIERPEALDTGHIVITGLNQDVILNAVQMVINNQGATREHQIPAEYSINNTSYRVVKLILGTAKLAHLWDGIVAA